jgi:hypothetical protein
MAIMARRERAMWGAGWELEIVAQAAGCGNECYGGDLGVRASLRRTSAARLTMVERNES